MGVSEIPTHGGTGEDFALHVQNGSYPWRGYSVKISAQHETDGLLAASRVAESAIGTKGFFLLRWAEHWAMNLNITPGVKKM